MKKELEREILESQKLSRTERRKRERKLQKEYNDKNIRIKSNKTFKKSECFTRKQRRELLKDKKSYLKSLENTFHNYFLCFLL